MAVAGELGEGFQIFFTCIAYNISRQYRAGRLPIVINGDQMISDVLFVEALPGGCLL